MWTIYAVKNYIRADEDDEMVAALMEDARSYMQGAISDFEERYASASADWQAKADLAMAQIVAYNYEHRGDDNAEFPASVRLKITQLQLGDGT